MLKDKRKVIFKCQEDMLNYISNSNDLYNLETGDYVFKYNDVGSGSFCVYNLPINSAENLEKRAVEQGEYWGGMLGPGGCIYDDTSHEIWEEGDATNLDYCEEVYNIGTWIDVTH